MCCIFLQDNRYKHFHLNRYQVMVFDQGDNQPSKCDFFSVYFLIKTSVTIIWCKCILSNTTTAFQCKFYIFCDCLILSFKYTVNSTTASIQGSFGFILGLLEVIVLFIYLIICTIIIFTWVLLFYKL